MILSTVLNLFVTPTLYVIIATIEDRLLPSRHSGNEPDAPPTRPVETPATI